MTRSALCLRHVSKGQPLPASYAGILDDAKVVVAGADDVRVRQWVLESLASASGGELNSLLLQCSGSPAGIISYDLLEDDAQIYFGYVSEPYREREGLFFKMAVDVLRQQGVRIVRTNFHWPSPERYIIAAIELGFVLRERLSMLRDNDVAFTVREPAERVEIRPWSDDWLRQAGQLLFDEADPVDREIYPKLKSLEGTVSDLSLVTCNCYGRFLPELSLVAIRDGALIGLLLSTEFEASEILIAEIAVAKTCRSQGIGSAMMGRVIRDSAAVGKRQLEVVVNAQNSDAIRLYEHSGFKHSMILKQRILVFQ